MKYTYNSRRVLELERKIQDAEAIIPQIDGKILKYNLINRAYGLAGLTIYGICAYVDPIALGVIASPLGIEGLADLITGKHHTITSELFKAHPKYTIERARKKIHTMVYKENNQNINN